MLAADAHIHAEEHKLTRLGKAQTMGFLGSMTLKYEKKLILLLHKANFHFNNVELRNGRSIKFIFCEFTMSQCSIELPKPKL